MVRKKREYWVEGGLCCGAPVVIGEKAVERIFEVKLTDEARKAFDVSVAAVKDLVGWVDRKRAS